MLRQTGGVAAEFSLSLRFADPGLQMEGLPSVPRRAQALPANT
jgi:hypothetical protein